MRLTLPVTKLAEDAKLPTYGTPLAIGLDLYANENGLIPARGRRTFLTGIAVAIPPTHYGRVAPRSGLAFKHGITVLGGVIDCDYRGDVSVMLANLGDTPVPVHKGDRIAQLVLERADFFEPMEVQDLPSTARGDKGFGSTGR